MPLQKIFLLPPLKGLNLYDNPFTMDPQFAVDLVNFMPPTTTFSVRPALEFIASLSGQVRGIFSYTTGISEDYGKHWYNTTIRYGAARELLIKLTQTDGTTHLYSIDPLGKTGLSSLGVIDNSAYNDDSVLYKHTLFFASGVASSSMNLYHQEKGLAKFALTIGDDGQTEIGDMQNLTIFKNFIFMSGNNSLNIFFIKAENADILNNFTWWKTLENLFSPQYGSSFTLDGIVQNGGSIIRLLNISRSGLDTMSTYLAAITDQGEIVLFDGTDPTDTTGEKWQIAGRFQIPPPLNKFCFAEMEGDLVVATKNGLVSLRRVIFGQSSQITESLEFRLLSLFSQYMFKMPSMSDFIGLYYHARNRLLIFNVPTDLPMPFNRILLSYNFNQKKSIVFPISADRNGPSDLTISRIADFVKNYIFAFGISYTLYIELDGDYSSSNIKISFTGTTTPEDGMTSAKCTVSFSLTLPDPENLSALVITNFLNADLTFATANINDSTLPVTCSTPSSEIAWNSSLEKKSADEKKSTIYSYCFSQKKDKSDYIVTNIMPSSTVFYTPSEIVTLGNVGVNENFAEYEKMTTDIFYLDKRLPNLKMNIHDFFISSSYANGSYTNQPPEGMFFDQTLKWGLSMHKVTVQALMNDNQWIFKNVATAGEGLAVTVNAKIYVDDDIYPVSLYFNWYSASSSHSSTAISLKITITISSPDGKTSNSYKVQFLENDKDFYEIDVSNNEENIFISRNSDYLTISTTGTFPWILDFSAALNVYLVWDTNYYWNTDPHETYSQHIMNDVTTVLNSQVDNPLDFQRLWGYLLTNSVLKSNVKKTPIKIDMENRKKKISVIDKQILTPSPSLKNSLPTDASSSTITNIDLTAIPLFDNIDIACNFGSTQYVFDSHFGTWSSFKDINMMRGIEHSSDFYFVVPNNIEQDASSNYIVTSSSLCRFNPDKLGDDILPYATPKSGIQDSDTTPISVRYKASPTFDFGVPNKKFFKKVKIFGTPSAFWQTTTEKDPKMPLTLIPFSDFNMGQPVSFVHAFDSDSISKKVLKKHFPHCKYVRELTFSENRKFWKLYAAEVDMIAYINLPLIVPSGSRFGLEVEMDIREAYVDIYGFEIFFDASQQML
jgi:hypothetical protein